MPQKRVIFCTYSSIYSSKVLEPLLADDNIHITAIINSTRVIHSDYGFLRGAIKQIQASGWRYATYLFMVTDLFRLLQPLFKIKKWPLKSIHGLARQHNIPLLDTSNINAEHSIQFIKKYKADYLLAAHFNQLVKAPVLNLPEMECINIHPSLLPSYKGVDPVFFAILDQNKQSGVSLHKMTEEFDCGEVLLQESILIKPIRTVCFYNCLLFEEGAKLALKWINNNASNHTKILDNSLGNYDSWPMIKQVRRFKKNGNKLIKLSELWKQQ